MENKETVSVTLMMALQVIRHLARCAEACADQMLSGVSDHELNDLLKLSRRCCDNAEHIAQYTVEAPTERWPLESALRDLEWLIAHNRGLLPEPNAAIILKSEIENKLNSMGWTGNPA